MDTEIRKLPEPQAFTDTPRPEIALASVESGQIKAVGYDMASKTLAIQFRHGKQAIYHYPGVEPETHAAFIGAESLGTFFRDHLKPLAFKKYAPEPAKEEAKEPTTA